MRRAIRLILFIGLVAFLGVMVFYYYPRQEALSLEDQEENALGRNERVETLKDYNDGKEVNIHKVRRIVERFSEHKAEHAEVELLRAALSPDEDVAHLSLIALQTIKSTQLISVAIAVIKAEGSELVAQTAATVLSKATNKPYGDDYEAWIEWYEKEYNDANE